MENILDFMNPENAMSEGDFLEWVSILQNNLCNWTLKEICDYTMLLVFHNQERLKSCGKVLLLLAKVIGKMKIRHVEEVIQREITKNAIEYLLRTNLKRLYENKDYRDSYIELTNYFMLYIQGDTGVTENVLNMRVFEIYDKFISEDLDLGEEL